VTTAEQPVMVDILTAAEQAIAVMRQHQLTTGTFEVKPGWPGAKGWNFAEKAHTRPILTEIQLSMFGKPAEFLRWAEHLNVERILVQRRDFDTCLHADADRDGLRWSIHTDTRRPYDGVHLPGITVDWIRQDSGRRGNEAYIPLPDLRATLAALGVVETAGAKGGQS
jgi:hypothetical protein